MGTRIKNLIEEMVLDYINSNDNCVELRNNPTITKIYFDTISHAIEVRVRFKPKGGGRKPNYASFMVGMNNKTFEDDIMYRWKVFVPKGEVV